MVFGFRGKDIQVGFAIGRQGRFVGKRPFPYNIDIFGKLVYGSAAPGCVVDIHFWPHHPKVNPAGQRWEKIQKPMQPLHWMEPGEIQQIE
jgi:hypothetical protein